MLKSVVWQSCLYRHQIINHMSSTAYKSLITSIKNINSYRITLSDPKTRYDLFILNTVKTLIILNYVILLSY